MYVTAIQPAKAIAAWPEGSPPRSGVPRPVHAFVAIDDHRHEHERDQRQRRPARSRSRSSALVAGSLSLREKTR